MFRLIKSIKKYTIFMMFFMIFSTLTRAEILLKDLNGEEIPFSSLSGKWIVINYWAPWCQPCLDEIPTLNRFYEQNQNVALFGINFDPSNLHEQRLKIEQLGIKYPNLQKESAESLNLGDIRGVPVTFIFNPQGKLKYKFYGKQSLSKLNRIVKHT